MIEPGYYQLNFGGMTLNELLRLGGVWNFPGAIIFKLSSRKVKNYNWQPQLLKESECDFSAFGKDVQLDLASRSTFLIDKGFEHISYHGIHPKAILKESSPNGGAVYLFRKDIVAAIITLTTQMVNHPQIVIKRKLTAFVSRDASGKNFISTSNQKKKMDELPCIKDHVLSTDDVQMIFDYHVERISKLISGIREFASGKEAIGIFDALSYETAEWRIKRKMYVYAGKTVKTD